MGALGAAGPAAEAHRQSSQDGTLPTPIVTGDKVDVLGEAHQQMPVAHKIKHLDALHPAILGAIGARLLLPLHITSLIISGNASDLLDL